VPTAHHHLFVRGKGDVEREIPIPAATHTALQAWLRVHPQRQGGSLRDQDVIFVRLARDGTRGAISQQALAKLMRRYAAVAGVPERLAHAHALRGYYAITLATEGRRDSGDQGQARARIDRDDRPLPRRTRRPAIGVADVLDRHYQAQRRHHLE
jgi:integrase